VVSRIEEIRGSTQVDYDAVRRQREQKIEQLENQVSEPLTRWPQTCMAKSVMATNHDSHKNVDDGHMLDHNSHKP